METRYLAAITVSLEGNLVRRYDLTYETTDPTENGQHSGNITLIGITQKGFDLTALPAMSLAYQNLPFEYVNPEDGSHTGFSWPHLITATNGYSGTVVYGYTQRDPDTDGVWSREVVTAKTVQPTFGNAQTTTFGYAGGPSYYIPSDDWKADSEYRGFNHVTVTDAASNLSERFFYTTYDDLTNHAYRGMSDPNAEVFTGREYRTEYRNSAGTLLRALDMTYLRRYIDTAGNINFVGLSQRDDTLGGSRSRTAYEYDSYGNINTTRDYDQSNTLYRYREATYRYNTSAWIVDRMGSETVRKGNGDWVAGAWYVYDNNTTEAAGPTTKGELTMVRRIALPAFDAGAFGGATADTVFGYDSYGNRNWEAAFDAGGYVYRTNAGAEGATAAASGHAGFATATAYDSTFTFPQIVTHTVHGVESATYNSFGEVATYTDPNNALTSNDYDPFGRLWKVWRPGESKASGHQPTLQYTYDDAARPFKLTIQQRTDLGGANTAQYHTTIRYYDGIGRLIQEKVQAEGGQYVETSTSYDSRGLKDRESVPVLTANAAYSQPNWGSLKNTSYAYDPLGRVVSVTGPDSTQTLTAYDNWTTKVRDPNGHRKESDRDAFGRLVAVRECSGTYADNSGACTVYATTTYSYDTRDQLAGVVDGSGSALQTAIGYDSLGRKTTMSDPDLGAGYLYRPDQRVKGRKTTMSDPDLGGWQYSYDLRGNLRQQTDARGTALLFGYDGESRLAAKGTPNATISAGALTQLRSDVNAQRQALGLGAYTWTDPTLSTSVRVRAVHFTELRDALRAIPGRGGIQYVAGDTGIGRTIMASDIADLRRWVYGDETYGQGMAATATYGYDAYDGSQQFGRGRRTSASTGASYSGAYRYDQRGRLTLDTQTIDGTGYQTGFAYDALDRPRSMSYPDAEAINLGYNDRTLLQYVSGYVTIAEYDPLGKPKSLVNGAGVTTNLAYDPNHFRLSSIGFAGSGAPSLSLAYTYDNAGNVQSIAESGTTTNYSYDHLDRLTDASGGYSAHYAYDVLGDLGVKTEGGSTKNLSYNLAVRPKHAPKTVDGVTQSYDLNGNLTSDGSRTFTYDAENRLATATSGGSTVQFVYDADGKRIKKIEGSQTTVYVGRHFEKNTTTGVITKYYEALGQPVATSQTGAGISYLYRDHLGSTTAASNGSTRSYWPFGAQRSSSGTTPTDRLYTGQRLDSIGLYDYGSREYDPELGRFISPDTIVPNPGNPQALNRFSYGLNNPLKYVDTTGHNPLVPPWLWGWLYIFVPPPPPLPIGGFTNPPIQRGPEIFVSTPQESAPIVMKGGTFDQGDERFPGADEVIKFPSIETATRPSGKTGGKDRAALREPEEATGKKSDVGIGENHHFFSNKGAYWPQKFKTIIDKYELDLNEDWNIGRVPGHRGRHPSAYQEWAFDQLQQIDRIAAGDRKLFVDLVETRIKNVIDDNPDMVHKDFWRND